MTDPMTPMPRRPSEPDEYEKRADFRALFARRIAFIAVALVAVVALGTTAYTALAIRGSQVSNTGTLNTSAKTLRIVQGCTTPGMSCYERGRKATRKAVGDINRVIVLASACAVGLDPHLSVAERQSAIQTCVIDRLSSAQTGSRP